MFINKLKRQWRAIIHKNELERELDEELRFHLERDIAQNIEAGMNEEEARYAAMRQFGGIEQSKEHCRDARGVRFIEELWQNIRYGLRLQRKNLGFTAIATFILALGIGASSAIFSVVNAVLLRPLPYKEPNRLVIIWDRVAPLSLDHNIVSPANYLDWQQQNHVFADMGAYTEAFFNLTDEQGANPERIAGMIASPGLFQTLGVQPAIGRGFLAEEGRAGGSTSPANPVVISHELWKRRFGPDPNVIGKFIGLNGGRYTVIGVMPEQFMISGKSVDVFRPLALNPEQVNNRGGRYLTVFARLKPGVSINQAQADMNSITTRLAEQYPAINKDRSSTVSGLEDEVFGTVRRPLFVLLGAVGFFLLITCANVGNLLFARFISRRPEIAIRTALGASRLRIVNQLFIESIILTLLGTAFGLVIASWGMDLIVALSPGNVPRIGDVVLNGRVLAFTAAMSILTALLFGLLPAVQASKTDLSDSLKGDSISIAGRQHRGARSMLVIVEVALSFVLLVGAGLMIKTFIQLQRVNPGFVSEHAVAMDLSLNYAYNEPQKRARFFQEVVGRVEALPGVRSAGVTDNLPLSGEDASRPFTFIDGSELPTTQKLAAEHRRISPHYFDAMGITLVTGRFFDEHDTDQSSAVVIVNETLARRFMPNQNPIGKRLIIDDGPPRPREIVGVVRDVKHFGLDVAAEPELYIPQLDRPWPNMTLVVRTSSADPSALVSAIRSDIATVDKSIPVANVKTIDQYLTASIGPRRFTMYLLGSFAALALLLVTVGIYGVTSYTVTHRKREIGIRMALGAQKMDVLRLILWQGTKLSLIGTGIGLIGALALTRLMRALLFGVSTTDRLTFAGVALLLAGVALVACYIPALRATKVDPSEVLRYE